MQDGRANKYPYPHDRRADKDSYSHDSNVTDDLCSLIKLCADSHCHNCNQKFRIQTVSALGWVSIKFF